MDATNLTTEDENGLYEIRLKGHLAGHWVSHFGDVDIKPEGHGITQLIIMVVDQAALFGLLKKIRDVGLPLLSVNRIEPGGSDAVEDLNQIHAIKGVSK